MLSRVSRILPRSVRQALKPVVAPLLARLPDNSTSARWVRGSYTPFGVSERERLFLGVARFCHINRPVHGYYFEFGCHTGRTMQMAWKHSRHLFDWSYVAFDSFEGLPEIDEIDRLEVFQKGKLATGEEEFVSILTKAGMPRDRLRTVKGFYDKTLTPGLAASLAPKKAVLIYIDCDLYASTVPVLEFIKDFLQVGTIIIFDDWFCYYGRADRGEQRAFAEFRDRHPELQFVPYMQTCEAQSFIFVGRRDAARLKSAEAELASGSLS